MSENIHFANPVLLVGEGNLTHTIAVCLLNSGHCVDLYGGNQQASLFSIRTVLSGIKHKSIRESAGRLTVLKNLQTTCMYSLAIVITSESGKIKRDIIGKLESGLSSTVLIAINSESIPLASLQHSMIHPERLIGLNWTLPAHTTRFLEIIGNDATGEGLVKQLHHLAKSCWDKDPYFVFNTGIRSRLMSAMIREAFYLVENCYATAEDIDRACRNDAGYYLPFAGNFRYMDLMGTMGYARVMKDLNPELSKDHKVPEFFQDIINNGGKGIQNGKGFYAYAEGEQERWEKTVDKFSYQIQKIINKYPFGYKMDS